MLLKVLGRSQLAGAVSLVTSPDSVVRTEAVGMADIAAGRAMATDAMFWIASMTKPVTATAILMLVDEGALSLDAPVTDYLPDFTPSLVRIEGGDVVAGRPHRPVTLRTLLSHTSGLPFSSSIETPTFDLAPIATQVRAYSLGSLDREPGADYAYSNAGFNVAARVIEVVSGQAYERFLQERLFEPLGMTDTTFWPDAGQVARLAVTYRSTATGLESQPISQVRYPLDDTAHRFPFAGGGLFSTAADMGVFSRMILRGGELGGHRFVSADAVREMSTDQLRPESQPAAATMRAAAPLGQGYGLGWSVRADGAFGHGGAYATMMRIFPRHGLATVWMVQHAGADQVPDQVSLALDEFESTATSTA